MMVGVAPETISWVLRITINKMNILEHNLGSNFHPSKGLPGSFDFAHNPTSPHSPTMMKASPSSSTSFLQTGLNRQPSASMGSLSSVMMSTSFLTPAQRRERVANLHQALNNDSMSALTFPKYCTPDLSSKESLAMILQDCLTTSSFLVPEEETDCEEDADL
jgi:hypothetical protein